MSINNTTIRKATINDIERIADIGNVAFRNAFINEKNEREVNLFLDQTYNHKQLHKDIEGQKHYYLIEKGNQVYGFILISFVGPYDFDDNWLKIERLYIDPIFIGQGLGYKLMKHVEQLAISQKLMNMWLEVLRTNENAFIFYEKLGFQAFDQAPAKFKADKEIDIWLKKEIVL